MSEKEAFQVVLNTVVERYGLELKKPYGDCGYIQFFDKSGTMLGEMNYEGYSLLYNCQQIAEALSALLR